MALHYNEICLSCSYLLSTYTVSSVNNIFLLSDFYYITPNGILYKHVKYWNLTKNDFCNHNYLNDEHNHRAQ